jgi:AraC-like DNA-binding protein
MFARVHVYVTGASVWIDSKGIPVTYCANELHLSPNYFGDLIKKETGSTALDYFQNKLVDEAKTKIFDYTKSMNNIATELGFKDQQHFTRLFKQKVGVTPNEFRSSLNSYKRKVKKKPNKELK